MLKVFKAFKAWVLRDVDNRNETSQGAITLRICSLVIIVYLTFLTGTMLYTGNASLILFNLMFMAVYGYLLWLTYCDMTKGALLWFNLATIGFVCFDVIYMGWNSGIQHFLFMLILLNLIFIYMSKNVQFVVTILLCIVRLCLYYYCRLNTAIVDMNNVLDEMIQIVTTACVFLLLFICGVMLSQDSQKMERKLTEYNNELQQLANTDALTKLWNRHHLMKYIADKIKEPYEFMSIAIGDIDFFKKINDTYGHECGDEVLRSLAKVFVENMDGKGVVARWGGEEFIFVYEHANGDEAKQKLAQLQSAVKKTVIHYEDIEVKVTMTFGLVEFDHDLNLDENICIADERLYQGKNEGRDRIIY